SLSLAQTLCFTRLLSVLKHDILLVQPANVTTGTEEAPLVLPPSITEFVADAVGVPESLVSGFWTRLREDIWHLPEQTLSEHEEASLTLYPASHHCRNSNCGRRKHLTNAEMRQVVVYTVGKGVVPAWEVQLYCRDCNTTYYPNFAVHRRTRMYYAGIPQYIQIGGHQSTERKLTGSWISLMLVAHVSATNCSRIYNMALS
ncbi:hypothetical protein C8R44DRAFT_553933, partial [Mycena epipterygia]